jgi:hypothetical protein
LPLASQAVSRLPQFSTQPFASARPGARSTRRRTQIGAQPGGPGGDFAEFTALVAAKLFAAFERLPQVGGRVGVVAGERRADYQGDDQGGQADAELGCGEARLFAQGAHQTSCSATASPSRLIAMRLVRSSASSW